MTSTSGTVGAGADIIRLAERMLESFGKDMSFFWANTHDSIVLEFPLAKSNGFAERVEGIKNVRPHFEMVIKILPGWAPRDIRITPFADPNSVLVEYRGSCEGTHRRYDQQYITILKFRDQKLVYFREYWDTYQYHLAWGNVAEARAAADSTG
jgi:ketosteroid isomerase-like protein